MNKTMTQPNPPHPLVTCVRGARDWINQPAQRLPETRGKDADELAGLVAILRADAKTARDSLWHAEEVALQMVRAMEGMAEVIARMNASDEVVRALKDAGLADALALANNRSNAALVNG